MKLIAAIGIFAFLLSGFEGFIHNNWHDSLAQKTCTEEMACCEDEPCCDVSGDGCEEEGEHDHSCDGDCDCCSCFHLTWIALRLPLPPPAVGIDFSYNEYSNEYYFEFQSPLIHPPRTV